MPALFKSIFCFCVNLLKFSAKFRMHKHMPRPCYRDRLSIVTNGISFYVQVSTAWNVHVFERLEHNAHNMSTIRYMWAFLPFVCMGMFFFVLVSIRMSKRFHRQGGRIGAKANTGELLCSHLSFNRFKWPKLLAWLRAFIHLNCPLDLFAAVKYAIEIPELTV